MNYQISVSAAGYVSNPNPGYFPCGVASAVADFTLRALQTVTVSGTYTNAATGAAIGWGHCQRSFVYATII